MLYLKFKHLPVKALKQNPRNARAHSRAQISRIAQSVKTPGFQAPILIDENNRALADHVRLETAKTLGLATVPVVRYDDMSEAEKRSCMLANNKLSDSAGWEHKLLAVELEELSTFDLDFDVTVTGFDAGEINVLTAEYDEAPYDGDQ